MIKYESIDDVIGSSDKRYFGTGYKRVSYIHLETEILDTTITSLYTITYPYDWSVKKKKGDLKPHLSTLDALVITIDTIEKFLMKKMMYSQDALEQLFVTSISIKAGKKLDEGIYRVTSEFNFIQERECCFIGKVGDFLITIRLKSENDDNLFKIAKSSDELIIKNIKVDKRKNIAECYSVFENIHKFKGINSKIIQNKHVVNLINHIIVAAQLTEVMHKHIDDISRDNSNTLIMRKVSIEYVRTDSQNTIKKVLIKVEKSKVLRVKNLWIRVSDMKSTIDNSIISYSVAQEISRKGVNK